MVAPAGQRQGHMGTSRATTKPPPPPPPTPAPCPYLGDAVLLADVHGAVRVLGLDEIFAVRDVGALHKECLCHCSWSWNRRKWVSAPQAWHARVPRPPPDPPPCRDTTPALLPTRLCRRWGPLAVCPTASHRAGGGGAATVAPSHACPGTGRYPRDRRGARGVIVPPPRGPPGPRSPPSPQVSREGAGSSSCSGQAG